MLATRGAFGRHSDPPSLRSESNRGIAELMVLSTPPRIAFLASPTPEAQAALAELSKRHGQNAPGDAEVIVALGGDGFMLQTLHRHGALGVPVFGMKLGTV